MRFQIERLIAWTDPVTSPRRSSGVFRASWTSTRQLLEREAALLGADLVVLQVDVGEADIRRDGMLRARAHVEFPGVVVCFDSDHGPLRYAADTYQQERGGSPPGWQANVRAIALALEALRAVDRYGVTNRAEQYVGFRALPSAEGSRFTSPDAAIRWMQNRARTAGMAPGTAAATPPRGMYRYLARRLHPDAGGTAADWEHLDEARQLLEEANLL